MSQVHSVMHVSVHSPLSEVCLPCWRAAQDDQGGSCGQERGRYETRGSSRSGKGLTIRLTDLRIFDLQIVWPFYLA